MCGSTKAPTVVKQDPVADQKAADARATQATNAETALRRRQAAQNSLLTLGAAGTDTLKKTPFSLLGSIQRGAPAKQLRRSNPKFNDIARGAFGDFSGLRGE